MHACDCHSHDNYNNKDDHWVKARLADAKARCMAQNLRFTQLRARVYELILQSDSPVGAYDLMDRLEDGARAPATVYRSLDFLQKAGLVHQITSKNAFVACCHPRGAHIAAFLLCQNCGVALELDADALGGLFARADNHNFLVKRSVVELDGLCANCH